MQVCNAKDQVVRIKLTRQTEESTEIFVRVGMLAIAPDRNAENLVLEKICRHF